MPSYLSINEFPGDGTTEQHEISFAGGYIDKAHVKAAVYDAAGVQTPITITPLMWVNDFTVDLGVSAPVGGYTRIYRDTPREEPLVNFADRARIREENLDLIARQAIFAAAEAFDAGAYAQVNDLLGQAGASAAAASASATTANEARAAAALEAAAASSSAATASAQAVAADASADAAAVSAADAGAAAAMAVAGVVATVATKVNRSGDSMTGNLDVPSLNGGQIGGLRNKILNGRMEYQQVPVTTVAAGVSAYTADQWVTCNAAGSVLGTLIVADAPAGSDFRLSHRITVTTADTAIAAADNAFFGQPLEGWNVRDLVGKTFTYGFWVKSSKVGVYCVALKNVSTRSYVAEITIDAANTWEYKTVTVVGGLPTAGTWDFTSGMGLYVIVCLAVGTTRHTTAGAWQAGDFLATANQVNFLDTVGATFFMTGAHLERGATLSRDMFEHRPLWLEFAMLQRYCELSEVVWSDAPQSLYQLMPWRVEKRVPPALSLTLLSGVGMPSFSAAASGTRSYYQSSTSSGTGTATITGMARM